jgi:hypothetical protein
MQSVNVIRRPIGTNNKPLESFFYYTGERLNPYRCGLCVTKAQHRQAMRSPTLSGLPSPRCCRKCGLDFTR